MYDWIPMEFDYDILIQLGGKEYAHYHCIANGEYRESFTVLKDGHLVLSRYSRTAVIDSMEAGSKINGMTLNELREAYYCGSDEDTTVDIDGLL